MPLQRLPLPCSTHCAILCMRYFHRYQTILGLRYYNTHHAGSTTVQPFFPLTTNACPCWYRKHIGRTSMVVVGNGIARLAISFLVYNYIRCRAPPSFVTGKKILHFSFPYQPRVDFWSRRRVQRHSVTKNVPKMFDSVFTIANHYQI